MTRSDRPTMITLIAAFYIITGLFRVVFGLFGTVFGTVLICLAPGMMTGGIWSVITGALNLGLGASVWTGKDWARWVVSLLAVIGIVTNLIGGLGLGEIISVAANIFVLVYMQGEEAKRFFETN